MTKKARIYYRKQKSSLINGVWKTGQLHAKESHWSPLSCYEQKKKFKNWLKTLNLRPETINLEKYIGNRLFDISISNMFLNTSPQARETNTKINKWEYTKVKTLYSKKNSNNTKRPLTEWEAIYLQIICLIRG